MRLLITGGAGFIGSNFARYWSERYPDDTLVVLDVLTYAGNRGNLADLESTGRVTFVLGDICDQPFVESTLESHQIDTIV
ncbi:MAG TPA: GDP-mannose 4,6-dehydratase, partial [Acidimicrobiales bacterium]|nr:GDP-mannose 4,6-dehydratase [Acidimicrobiales bacterium]